MVSRFDSGSSGQDFLARQRSIIFHSFLSIILLLGLFLGFSNATALAASALSGVSLAIMPTSPCAVKSTITLTATANGGGSVVYQFLVNGVVVQDYAAGAVCTWTPTTAGTFPLTVKVKDLSVASPKVYASTAVSCTIKPLLSAVNLTVTPVGPRPVNTPITMKAAATGGANVVYQFLANGVPIQNYSASTTCTWTPNASGNYLLLVQAKDMHGSGIEISSSAVNYTVTDALMAVYMDAQNFAPQSFARYALASAAMLASPTEIMTAGTPITLMANAEGGANIVYRFLVNGVVAQAYKATNVYTWTPKTTGNYALVVTAKDLNGSTTEVASVALNYTIIPALSAVKLSAPSAPRPTTATIPLTAGATGGKTVVYQFLVNDVIVQDYSDSATCTWTPDTAGACTLQVRACDLDGADPSKAVSSTVLKYTITPVLTAVALTATPVAPRPVNTPITLRATATGGASLAYQYLVNGVIIHSYGFDPTCTWIPRAAGSYLLVAQAKDLNGDGTVLSSSAVEYTITDALSAVTVGVQNPDNPGLASSFFATPNIPATQTFLNTTGTPITLVAGAAGGANVVYQFLINGVVMQSYKATTTYTWTPNTAGSYSIVVKAKDLNGAGTEYASAVLKYTIAQALTAVSLTAAPASSCPVNTAVKLTAMPVGGSAVLYQFLVNGMVARDYAATAGYTWTPTTSGSYTLQVIARNLNGAGAEISSAVMNFSVNPPLSAVSLAVSPAPKQRTNSTITLQATATGGANVVYQFRINGVIVQSFGATASYAWRPATAGNYTLKAEAKDLNGKSTQIFASSQLSYEITDPLIAVSLVPPVPHAVYDPIGLTAVATGGTNRVYQFWANGTVVQDYSRNANATWTPTAVGAYSLQVKAKDLNGDPSVEVVSTPIDYTVIPGEPAQLAFSAQPVDTATGSIITPAVTVLVQDAWGNTVSWDNEEVTLAIANNAGGGTISGTTTVHAVNGVATFDDLSISNAGSGYTLSASTPFVQWTNQTPVPGNSVLTETSAAFNVISGQAAQLAFGVQPGDATAGATINPDVTVLVQDANGYTVTDYSGTITLAIGRSPNGLLQQQSLSLLQTLNQSSQQALSNAADDAAGLAINRNGSLTGTLTVDVINGVADFSDLAIRQAGAGYTLIASADGFNPVESAPFTINAGAPAQLVFDMQPSQTTAGDTINGANTQLVQANQSILSLFQAQSLTRLSSGRRINTAASPVTVLVEDACGNIVTDADLSVTLTLDANADDNTQPVLTLLQQSMACSLNTAADDAASLSTGKKINSASDDPAGLAISPGLNTNNNLRGTLTVKVIQGVASFSNLSIAKAGSYYLHAAADGLTAAESAPFAIVPGQAVQIAFGAQPGNTQLGNIIGPAPDTSSQSDQGTLSIANQQPQAILSLLQMSGANGDQQQLSSGLRINSATSVTVLIEDACGNVIPIDDVPITLAIGNNPSGGMVTGTLTVNTVSGIANFSDLAIDTVGSGYTLIASTNEFDPTESNPFDITLAPAQLAFGVQPQTTVHGTAMTPAVTVQVLDGNGNIDTSANIPVTLIIGNDPNANSGQILSLARANSQSSGLSSGLGNGTTSTLSGTLTVNAVNGVATFPDLSIDKIGSGYTLIASTDGVNSTESAAFDVVVGPPVKLFMYPLPPNASIAAGTPLALAMMVQDTGGYMVPMANNAVTISLGSNPAGGALYGPLTVNAANGMVIFRDLSITKAGTGYTFTMTSPGLAPFTTNPFTVTPAAAAKLAFIGQPSNANTGDAISLPVVAVQDAYGNLVTTATNSISITMGNNPASSDLLGTLTVNAAHGVATFNDLSIKYPGAGYTLHATADGLTAADSAAFNISEN